MEHSEILDLNRLEDKTLVKEIVANADKFYLLPTGCKQHLCDIIDKLSKNSSDKSALTRVRIAYNLEFSLPTHLCRGSETTGKSVKTLAELLDEFDYDENLVVTNGKDFHVVMDDEQAEGTAAEEEVARLFQQTVFLNLDIDIKKKSEIRKALIKERFRANYLKLRGEIAEKKNYLANAMEHADLTDSGKKRVEMMVASFDAMSQKLEEARQRPIRIAAMGTKKAGKSVVINSLLKCDYAPTSSELPTPNVIKYIPAPKDAPLTLDYKDEVGIRFASAKELSDYIGSEFEKAQKHTGEGSGLADMVIHYPCDELSGYEVWDTPGPNFAGAGEEHHKIADECIKNADVCIFVMNYSNHLTDDEVKFLKKIHTTFKEENKFYSLFITVNRIDERYAAEVEKTVNRILDYIRLRLEELDYRNIMIFGTSALQSFYLDKVLNLLSEDDMTIETGEQLSDAIRKAKRNHRDFMTQLRFVEDSIKNLEDFHEILDPDVKLLETFSGIPQLWHHVRYIGEQKVDTEIVDHVVSRCESEFDKINNALLVTELVNLSEEDSQRLRELKEQFDELRKVVNEAMSELVSHQIDPRAIKYDIGRQIDSTKRSAIKSSVDRGNVIADRAPLTDADVEAMQGGSITDNIQAMLAGIDEILQGANRGSEESFLRMIQMEGEDISQRVEEDVNKAQAKIIKKTEEVKQSVISDSVAGNLMSAFAVPEFPVSLSRLSGVYSKTDVALSNVLTTIAGDATRVDSEIRTRPVLKKNKDKWFFQFWKDDYVEEQEEYEVPVERADARKFRSQVKLVLAERIKEKLEESHETMREEVEQKIDDIFDDVKEQCGKIGKTYEEIFYVFASDINDAINETDAHKNAIEHDIVVLKDIKEKIIPFSNLWHGILDTTEGM